MKPKVNDKFKEWMNHNYGKHGEVKSNRRRVHEYLGKTSNFIKRAKVKIKVDNYVGRTINEFPMKINNSDMFLSPSGNNIYKKATEKGWVKKKLKSSKLQYQEEFLCPR